MNRTHLEHTVIAVLIQLALWPVFGLVIGGLTACAVFLGREIAQHEYKLALSRGWVWGQKKPVHWFEGLLKGWSKDSVLDIALPVLACGLAALIGGVWL